MNHPGACVPRGAWRRASDAWYRLLQVLMVLALVTLLVPVTLQIVSRHTDLLPTYIWTEELARLTFIWTIMIGAMVGMKERAHFIVDVWPDLSPRAAAALDLVAGLGNLGFALVFVWAGWEFTAFAFYRISELAELPLWTIHIAWPVLGASWLLFQGEQMMDTVHVLTGGTSQRTND